MTVFVDLALCECAILLTCCCCLFLFCFCFFFVNVWVTRPVSEHSITVCMKNRLHNLPRISYRAEISWSSGSYSDSDQGIPGSSPSFAGSTLSPWERLLPCILSLHLCRKRVPDFRQCQYDKVISKAVSSERLSWVLRKTQWLDTTYREPV